MILSSFQLAHLLPCYLPLSLVHIESNYINQTLRYLNISSAISGSNS